MPISYPSTIKKIYKGFFLLFTAGLFLFFQNCGSSMQSSQDLSSLNPALTGDLSGGLKLKTLGDFFYSGICGLGFQGEVYCWGGFEKSAQPAIVAQVPDGVAVVGNVNVKCVLTSAGKVYCWGGYYVGTGDSNPVTTPVEITGLGNVLQISAGNMSVCAVNSDEKVYCWGYLYGLGTPSPMILSPFEIMSFRGAKKVAQSVQYVCVITVDDVVKCIDGSGNTYPIPGLTGSIDIKAGGNAISGFCVLNNSSNLNCFGKNGSADVTLFQPTNLAPVKLYDLSSGGVFCGVQMNDDIKCWGSNASKQINNSATAEYADSQLIKNLKIKEIRTADTFSCVLTEQNSVQCWGSGNTITPL